MRKAVLLLCAAAMMTAAPAKADGPLREFLRSHRGQKQEDTANTLQIAGLTAAYWLPDLLDKPAPLVIFSHGFEGCKTQSTFLMKALAADGYIVVAPDHKDAGCGGGLHKPEEGFGRTGRWTDQTYIDRRDDILNLYAALRNDKDFSAKIDWRHVGLAGHSLGGYTVLALAGGWPSWKMKGISAVLALSPYAAPLADHGDLAHIGIPVMYQGGTRDLGITPGIRKSGGAYDQTPNDVFVEFDKTGHFGWTDLQKGAQGNIALYSLWFFDKTLKGIDAPTPQAEGVTDFRQK